MSFNEKIQWLKLYDRKEIYHTIVDKCEVKKYVSQKIGEEYFIQQSEFGRVQIALILIHYQQVLLLKLLMILVEYTYAKIRAISISMTAIVIWREH